MALRVDSPENGKAELWFEEGNWRIYCRSTRRTREISSLIRNVAYDAAALAKALWLRKQRAVAAARRLREGCPVKQLAAEYGFRHPGDFSVEFKRWYGMAPGEFIRRVTDLEHVGDDEFWPENLSD